MSTQNLSHLSIFSGIGGLDLAAEWAGFQTVGQCEWADYPTKVLEKHWPDVPRWRDIRTLTKESFYERTGLRTVDIISGGFPCQPFSVAGKRRGSEDDRYLWPEMLRVIKELRPRWVIGENVAGIVNMALDTVLSDLEGIGYTCQAFIIPACAVDAPHRRDRCAIVAFNNSFGRRENGKQKRLGRILDLRKDDTIPPQKCGSDVPNPDDRRGLMRRQRELSAVEETGSGGSDHGGGEPEHGAGERRPAQPGLGRVATRFSDRVDGGIDYECETKTSTNKDLLRMRESNGTETIQRQAGGYWSFSKEEILRPGMYGKRIQKTGCDIVGVTETQCKDENRELQNVRCSGEFTGPPHRQEPGKQCSEQYYNTLRKLPYKAALDGGESHSKPEKIGYWLDEPLNVPRIAQGVKDRVGRLKCLGNAVVPQQFYPIFKAIAEIELEEHLS